MTRLIESTIQKICISCYIELTDNEGPVDQDGISVVTDQDACEFDHVDSEDYDA